MFGKPLRQNNVLNPTLINKPPFMLKPRVAGRYFLILVGCGAALMLLSGAAIFPKSVVRAASHAITVDTLPVSDSSVQARTRTRITIKLNQVLGKISANAFGLSQSPIGNNTLERMYFFRDPAGKQLLRELGAKSFYYSTDRQDWQQVRNEFTAVPEVYPSQMDTLEYLNLSGAVGAEPMVAVNITQVCRQTDSNRPPSTTNVTCTSAKPGMAASWIKFLKHKTPRIKYVALGIEPYAGCPYWIKGWNCTVEHGMHKVALPQEEYAKRVLQWAKALKARDPSIQIGVHLQPNTYLCRNRGAVAPERDLFAQVDDVAEVSASDQAKKKCGGVSWDETVLKKASSVIDFVIVHQYFAIDTKPANADLAARYSYYQEQIDVRRRKNGETAMPFHIREELVKWLPSKKSIPILVAEFNVARLLQSTADDSLQVRSALFVGMSLTELFLDLAQPVQVGGETLPGAFRSVLLDLDTLPVFIAHYQPLDNPQLLIFTPAWHMLSMVQAWQGKTTVAAQVANNPRTFVNRPALRVYAAKEGRTVFLAVFNHDSTNAITSNVILDGAKIKNASALQLGAAATTFLDGNTLVTPEFLVPVSVPFTPGQVRATKISSLIFPAHSLTVLKLQLKK